MGPCWRPLAPGANRKNLGNCKVWEQKLGGPGEVMETNSRGGFLAVFRPRLGSFREPVLASLLTSLPICYPLACVLRVQASIAKGKLQTR